MRLFFAVDFSDEVKEAIDQAIRRFPIALPPWRWIKKENLHLTLKFLGEMDEGKIDGLVRCASHVSARQGIFHIGFGAFGGFPSLTRPRVLFYAIDRGAGELARLSHLIEEALSEEMSIPRERRPFRAHATVARIKEPLSQEVRSKLVEVEPLKGVSQTVKTIFLMRSELRREGARYHRLKEIALGEIKC